MKPVLIPNWTEKNLKCNFCGANQSVKYAANIKGSLVYICNKCVLSDKKIAKETIMANQSLSDMEKLKYVFDISKEELKANDPQLYYAILAVMDATK